MRRSLATLLVVLLLAPELPAHSNNDWANVKKLKPGTVIEVLLWNGDNLRGELDTVTDAKLQIATADPSAAQANWLRDLDRKSVRRIVRTRQPHLPDSRRWMIAGTVGGAAIGTSVGIAGDIKHGGNYHWFEGAFGGAAMGFVASCAALLVVIGIDLGQLPRRRQVVYEDYGSPRDH